jgi:hypothetical protein
MTAATTLTVASRSNLDQYEADGYTLIKNLIPRDLIPAVRAELALIEEGRDNWPAEFFHIVDPKFYLTPTGKPLPGGVQLPARHSADFKAIADHPRLQQAMSDLLGGPVTRHTDQVVLKSRHINNEQGGRSFFHQDSYYWKIAPRLGCNAWIALDTVGKGAIALAVMPRSQVGWTLTEHEAYYDDPAYQSGVLGQPFKRYRIPHDKIDYSKDVLVPMEPGDALFFTNYTWHRSEANRTGKTLCAYAIAYKRA